MTDLRIEQADSEAALRDWQFAHNTVIPTAPLSLDDVRERAGRNRLDVMYRDGELVGCATVRPPADASAAATVIARILPVHRGRASATSCTRTPSPTPARSAPPSSRRACSPPTRTACASPPPADSPRSNGTYCPATPSRSSTSGWCSEAAAPAWAAHRGRRAGLSERYGILGWCPRYPRSFHRTAPQAG